MNWIEVILIGGFVIGLVAIMRHRRNRAGSCCSGEGMDDDGYTSIDWKAQRKTSAEGCHKPKLIQ